MARDKKDIIKDGEGTQFGNGQPTNLGGRKKSLIKQWNEKLKEDGYELPSVEDYDKIGLSLLDMPFSYLLEITAAFTKNAIEKPTPKQKEIQDKYPYFVCLIARDLMGKNGFQVVEKIRDRAHGKPVNIDNKANGVSQPIQIVFERVRKKYDANDE